MHPLLRKNVFVVKEHVGLLKAANNFDVLDPETGAVVLECREENLGPITKLLRFTDYKRMTPFELIIRPPGGAPMLVVRRGISLFLSNVAVTDGGGTSLGSFQQRLFSIGGAFQVSDAEGRPTCELKGSWTSWEFKFLRGDATLATVSREWGGLGRELLTTADNYVLNIEPTVAYDDPVRALILAAVLCIDMVLKE
ncbi:MAG: phospholipid scramblase-related protein [Myxococcota bacterium]